MSEDEYFVAEIKGNEMIRRLNRLDLREINKENAVSIKQCRNKPVRKVFVFKMGTNCHLFR